MGDLAQDLLAVGDALSPREAFRVVGHDIGSQTPSIAPMRTRRTASPGR